MNKLHSHKGKIVIWAMITCFNLIIVINSPSTLGWILVGIPLGILIDALLEFPFMKIEQKIDSVRDKLNKLLLERTKRDAKIIKKLKKKK